MVQIYYGRAGSGKTNLLIKRASDTSRRVFFVVPEQLSMTTERTVNELGLKGVSVLNFSRLANTVFRSLGKTAKKLPDTAMSTAAICLAVDRVYDKLCHFKSIAHTHGFITKLIETFSDFDVNCISEKGVMSISDELLPKISRDKYRDLFLIYNEYKNLWSNEYKAPGDDMSLAAGLLETSDIFSDAVFMFDGFNGYTAGQHLLLREIISQAAECNFAFTTDLESDIFSTVTTELYRIERLCNECDIKPIRINTGNICHRFESESLRLLEKNIFTDTKTGSSSDITVYGAKNISDELGYIACKIKNDVLEGKYRYRDIAVISPDADAVSTVADAVFKKHGVPVYIDSKQTLALKPITAFVLHALEIVTDGFEFESVFSFLKTGLTGIEFNDISLLENYVRMWRLKPRDWTKDKWELSPSGLTSFDKESDDTRLEKLNALKTSIVTPLISFSKKIKNATSCRDMLYAVILLLEQFEVESNLLKIADIFKEASNLKEYEDTVRVYGIFIDFTDSIEKVMGNTNVSPRRFYDILSSSASQVVISSRPARADEVTFACLGRVRTKDKKCIYIPRMNSTVIPATLSDSSLITEADKRIFLKVGIPVSNDFLTSGARERFDLYSAVCSPSKEIVFTYSQFKITGEPLLKSDYLENIINITEVLEKTDKDLPHEFHFVSLSALAGHAASKRAPDLYKAVKELGGLTVTELERDKQLTDNVVEGLYSKSLKLSFSGIEEYIECPFKFFLHRGLRISKNEPIEFNSANMGTFIHYGLERLLLENDVTTADEKKIGEYIDGISKDYYSNQLKDCKNRSNRFDYLFERAKEVLVNAAWNVTQEIQSSEFKPIDFEVDISEYIKPWQLENGYTLTLTGSIDRVDSADTEDGKLAKIIDYKSGKKSFSLKNIYNGISMQLPIYAGAVRAKHSDITIAALYYLKVGTPSAFNGTDGFNDDDYKEAVKSCYSRDGIFLDGDTMSKLDKTGTLFGKIKKDRVIDYDAMNTLMDHTMNKIYKTGCDVTGGIASISPLCDSQVDACAYCDYKDICKIDSTPEKVRKLEPLPDGFLKSEVSS